MSWRSVVTDVVAAARLWKDAQDRPTKLCKHCGNAIPEAAILCSECKSYQDWRGWLPISSTALALITALVSVTGVVGPAIYKLFHTPRSDVTLSMPLLEGTTIRLLAVNRGDAAAALTPARLGGDYLAPATRVRLRNDADAVIPSGSKLLTFDIVPLLSEKQSYESSLEAMWAAAKQKPLPATWIAFGVAQSDGTVGVLRVDLTADDMFELLRANADRCSAIEKADFINGCVGTGAPTWIDDMKADTARKQRWRERTRMPKRPTPTAAPTQTP